MSTIKQMAGREYVPQFWVQVDRTGITLPSGMRVGFVRGCVMLWCLTRMRVRFFRGCYDFLTGVQQMREEFNRCA